MHWLSWQVKVKCLPNKLFVFIEIQKIESFSKDKQLFWLTLSILFAGLTGRLVSISRMI